MIMEKKSTKFATGSLVMCLCMLFLGLQVSTLKAQCDGINPGPIMVGTWTCSGGNASMTLTGVDATPEGGVYSWQTSTDGTTWTNIEGATSATLDITTSGQYRRGYTMPDCTPTYSNGVVVVSPADYVLGDIQHASNVTSVCKGSDFAPDFSATVTPTATLEWEFSADGSTFQALTVGSTEQPLNETIYVRYRVAISSTCELLSSTYTVQALDLPVVNSITVPENPCPSTSYNISADVTMAGDAAITDYIWSDNVVVTDGQAAVTATTPECETEYTVTLKVKDANNCVSAKESKSFTTNLANIRGVGISEDQDAVAEEGCVYKIPNLIPLVEGVVQCDCPVTFTQTPEAGTVIEKTATRLEVHVTAANACGNTLTFQLYVVKPELLSVTLNSDATDNMICHGEAVNFEANANRTEGITYTWSEGLIQDATDLNKAVRPGSTEASALTAQNNTYSVTVTDNIGCTATKDITITTLPKADRIENKEDEICMPAGYEHEPTNVPENTTYTWTVKSNTDNMNNAADQATAQNSFILSSLTNTTLAYQTVVYEVTPVTTTNEVECVGEKFEVSLTVKPSITTEGAITDFANEDVNITLWYGACDTAYYVQTPTYVNNIAEYDGLIVMTNDKSTANEGTIFGRMTPGTYTITWKLTDPCGNFNVYEQNFIVNYPPCGGDVTATDGDGNTYESVRVGCECWTKSNLRTETYSDGSAVESANVYTAAEIPAVDPATFGLLYTWYSAMHVAEGDNNAMPTILTANGSNYPYVQGVCPEGWAIPTASAYQSIMSNANVLRSTEADAWLPGTDATDVTGFGAYGAGYYDAASERYVNLMGETYFWSAETSSVTNGTCSILTHTCPQGIATDKVKGQGFSVRCVKRDN